MEVKKPLSFTATESSTRLSSARDINAEHEATLSPLERMAISIYDHVGTPGFFLIIAFWTTGWVCWNVFAPPELRLDKAMEFTVWVFISNVIQMCMMPLLLIAQNMQTRHDRMRADNDFQLTAQSEQEIQLILGHLYLLNKRIESIMEQLDLPIENAEPVREREPDLQEEEFAQRQQEMLDVMALKLAQTHEIALRRFQGTEGEKPKRRLPR